MYFKSTYYEAVELREVGIFTAIGIEIRTEAQGSKLGLFIGQVVIVSR